MSENDQFFILFSFLSWIPGQPEHVQPGPVGGAHGLRAQLGRFDDCEGPFSEERWVSAGQREPQQKLKIIS